MTEPAVQLPLLERAAGWGLAAVSRHIATSVPIVREDVSVEAALAELAERPSELAEVVYVVDRQGAFVGAVPPLELLRAPRTSRIGAIVDRGYPRMRADESQEDIAGAALAHRAISVAVVDADGRMLGAVPARALLAILREEHVEDLHRLSGIQREAARDRGALEAPPARRARHRLPWLLVGLAGSMLAAALVSGFEQVLEQQVAVAFFVPAIVYLADAIGTQTEAIAVRGLSLSRLSLRSLVAGELRTGILIGLVLAGLAFPVVALVFGDPRLGLAVGTAILAAGSLATTIGLLLPWVLHRYGSDPAFGSGPLATIVQDLASLLIYFVLAALILR